MSDTDIAAKDEVVADTTATESAPVETASTATAEDIEAGFDDVAKSIESEETEDTKEKTPTVDETDSDKQPESDKNQSPEDEWNSLKGNSQERFRQAINERNELRQRMSELEARKAQFATEQDLLNEVNPETGYYYTPQEAERVSWQQSRQAQAERADQELYQLQVQQNQVAVEDEATRVTQEFGLLNPGSKEYNPQIAAQYGELLNDSLLYTLPNGQKYNRSTLLQNGINPETQATLVGYNTSPYKLAKSIATSYEGARVQGETIGQAKAQRATEQMLANADVPSGKSGATPKAKEDPLIEGYDTY